MTDYTELAENLEEVDRHCGSESARKAAAILRSMAAVDVTGVMDLARKWVSHPFSNKNRVALESAIRALAARGQVRCHKGAMVREFENEIGNHIKITIEGPTSTSENILTPMEVTELRRALIAAAPKGTP
jgi:hypothetical protein